MAKVNSESSNTDAMFRHQLLKKNKQSADTKKNVEVDFGVEESAGTKIFDWRLTNCLNARAPAPSAGAGGAAASSSEAPPAGGKSKSSEGSGSFSGVEKILVPQDRRHHLASDADSQLLLRVFFNGPVTVTGLQFRCDEAPKFACKSEGGEEEDDDFQPPNNVQIFANQDGLDFSDIEDYKVGSPLSHSRGINKSISSRISDHNFFSPTSPRSLSN